MLSNTEDLPELCSHSKKVKWSKILAKSLKFPHFVPLKPSKFHINIEKGEETDLAADNGNRGKSFP